MDMNIRNRQELETQNGFKTKYQRSNSQKLIGSDGIRALACLAVIGHHINQRLAMEAQSNFIKELQSFFLMGNTGVSVFFVLSGFLLSYPFWKKYLDNKSFPSIKDYAIKRAARIMPGFYIALVTSMAVILLLKIDTPDFGVRFLAGFTFMAGFNYKTFFPSDINGPLWSISFEVFCYFIMPLFMFGLYKISGKKRSFTKGILFWVGASIVTFIGNALIHQYLTPDDFQRGWQYGNEGGAKYWMPNYNVVGFFEHFTIGIFAAGITVKLFSVKESLSKMHKYYLFDFIGAVSLISSFILLYLFRHTPEFSYSFQNQPYFYPFYTLLIGIALIALSQSIIVGRFVDNFFFRYTAKVSFGLYIWHYLFIYIVSYLWVKDYQYMGVYSLSRWAMVSLAIIVVSYITATLSYEFIEKPIIDWAHNRNNKYKNNKISA